MWRAAASAPSPASARCVLTVDGKLTVSSATADIGTGTYTIMTQIAADLMGVPIEDVTFELGDSSLPSAPVEGDSFTASSVGSAVKAVCDKAREQLLALARQLRCAPGTAARAHGILRDAGVIGGAPRSRAVVAANGVAAALMMGAHAGVVRLSGSDDPALDLLLSAAGGGVERAVGGRGSVAGLGMLAQGAVDAAAVHLRDARTGRYNDVFARRVLGGEPALLVHLWSREQGIVVPKGNPLGIRGMADLDGVRLAWRPPRSETQRPPRAVSASMPFAPSFSSTCSPPSEPG